MVSKLTTTESYKAFKHFAISLLLSVYWLFFELILQMSILNEEVNNFKSTFDVLSAFLIVLGIAFVIFIMLRVVKLYDKVIISTLLIWFPLKLLIEVFSLYISKSFNIQFSFYMSILLATIIVPYIVLMFLKRFKLSDILTKDNRKLYGIMLIVCIIINVLTFSVYVSTSLLAILFYGFG